MMSSSPRVRFLRTGTLTRVPRKRLSATRTPLALHALRVSLPERGSVRMNSRGSVVPSGYAPTSRCLSLPPTHTIKWGGDQQGPWHPCPLPQGRLCHHRAWPVILRQLGPLPPTQRVPWGGAPKGQWHPRPLIQGRHHHRQARPVFHRRLDSPPLHPSFWEREQAWQSIGLPPSFSVGNGASGFVAGLTSRLC